MSVDEVSSDLDLPEPPKRRSRWRTLALVFLAGPLALITSTLVMMAMPLWFPPGPARVDNIIVPLLVYPLIWACLLFHALLDEKLLRVAAVSIGLAGLSTLMIALKMLGMAFQA